MSGDDERMEGISDIVAQVRAFSAWMPLISFGQRFIAETDSAKRALVVGDAFDWLASKSATKLDDELVDKINAVLRTPEGENLVRWIVSAASVVVANGEVKS